MEILGVGWQEFIFILIIALIVLGPKDMQKAGRTIGRWLNQLVKSDGWKAFQHTTREIQNLPRNLMRQANMELQEAQREVNKTLDPRLSPPPPLGRKPGANPNADEGDSDNNDGVSTANASNKND